MAVPSPSEAEAATQRVRVVADMLRQKASEVQSKGNAGAAKSLSDSAVDLQRAAELLHELTRHVHALEPHAAAATPAANGPPRSQEGRGVASNGAQPPASTSVKDLVAKLGRVDAMLGKKSDEMKAKGNEAAAHALLQSALAVRVGAQHIGEQQQMTRTLVVTARALREQLREQCRLLLEGVVEISDETALDDELRYRAMEEAKQLLAIRGVVRDFHPKATTAQALRQVFESLVAVKETPDLSEEVVQWREQCERLQQQISDAQSRHELELRAARQESASKADHCTELEKSLQELETECNQRRELEVGELNTLLERQKCESEELKRLLQTREEELGSLKIEAVSVVDELSKEREAQNELQAQYDADRKCYEQQLNELQGQLEAMATEVSSQKQELLISQLRVTELEQLQHEPLSTEVNSLTVEAELQKQVEELRRLVEDVQRERDGLVGTNNDARDALVAAEAQLDSMASELKIAREDTKKFQDEATAFKQRIMELESALETATSQLSQAQQEDEKAGDNADEIAEQRETIDQLKVQLDKQQHRHEEMATLLTGAQSALLERESEIEEHVRRLAELRELNTREMEELKTNLGLQHGQQLAGLQVALKNEQDQVAALQESLEARASSVDKQSAHVVAVQKALEAKEFELAEHDARLEALQLSIHRLADDVEGCTSLSQLHEVCGSEDDGLGRLLQTIQKHVSVYMGARNAEADSVKAELITLLHELSEENIDDNTVAMLSLAQSVHERVLRLVSDLKALRVKLSESVSSQQEVVEAAKREMRDSLSMQHDAVCEELRAQVEKVAGEKSELEEKLRTAQAEHATTASADEGEVTALKTKLADLANEFERYRTRSHAALKKVEKRAELLNGMRKENEGLMVEIAKLKESHDSAAQQEETLRAELDEVTKILRQREENEASQAKEAAASMQELKDQCEALEAKKEELEIALRNAVAKTAELQEEKETLANNKHELHERELLAKEGALQEVTVLLDSTKTEVSEAQERIAQLEAAVAEAQQRIQELETQVQAARTRAVASADERDQEVLVQQEKLSARVAELKASVEAKDLELSTVVSAKDAEHAALLAELEQRHAAELQETVALAQGSHEQSQKAEEARQEQLVAESAHLKSQITELESAKATAEQEAARLRLEIESLKAAVTGSESKAAAAHAAASTQETFHSQALQESLDAKEAQIMRLLTELEGLSKHQLEDQHVVAELKEKLRQSELRVREIEKPQQSQASAQASESADNEALNETIQALRTRVAELEFKLSNSPLLERFNSEENEVEKLNAIRLEKRAQQEQDSEKMKRQQRVSDFTEKARQVVQQLQLGLEEYSSVFRDACALRDEAPSSLAANLDAKQDSELNGDADHRAENEAVEYEEYLTFNSGVVIKAGSTFSLPVYCEKPGWRVQWKFAVKEEGADVGYTLSVVTKPQGDRQTIVTPARVNELSGVCDAPASSGEGHTTAVLHFEWDNTFSWLNEKTLDYHVSILEPLSAEKKSLRTRERALAARAKMLETQLMLLGQEKERRDDLQQRLLLVEACEKEKEDQVSGFEKRKLAIKDDKTKLQVHMEDLKQKLSALVSELDEIENHGRAVATAWETLQGELEDVDMTMRLSANSRLDELAATLQSQFQQVGEELATMKKEQRSGNA